MGWKRGYFYRSERVGGQVRSRYLGAGTQAEDAAVEVEERREAARSLVAQRKAERAARAEVDAEYEQVRALVTAHLLAQGLHQSNRQWRRYREQGD